MNINLQYRDDQGNVVRLQPHQPLTGTQVLQEVATAGLIVAIVVTVCILLL